jgi:uncharacterized protein (TIGR03084 family)
MPVNLGELVADLAAETADVRALVSSLDETGWRTPTPAAGWAIGDQISHLAFFDDATVTAATDPDRFAADLAAAAQAGRLTPDDVAARYRALDGVALLTWFDGARGKLIDIFGGLDPARRLPWFGPPMSATSAITARIMETWAHGQDIADALGAVRPPTDRLRHVAHIGIRALPYSFAINGLPIPADPVRVELTGPADDQSAPWTWGPADAANRVTGPALEFCLLVTQRRHRTDTSLIADGAVADRWLDIAQAFAGPPGSGRSPGQHY